MAEIFSPETFNPTATRGIVSTAERRIDDAEYTQFDARVSPGNSGGPLLNTKFEVVAIVTLAGKRGDGPEDNAEGYNFGLLLDQIRDELAPYTEVNTGKP